MFDANGYPTEEFLDFIKDYDPKDMPILEFVEILRDAWEWSDWGFKLHRKYAGKRKLELHTGGWSGNESIISAIKENFWFTAWSPMRYVKWEIGGHHYFEIIVDRQD